MHHELTLSSKFQGFGSRQAHHDTSIRHSFEHQADKRRSRTTHSRHGIKVLYARTREQMLSQMKHPDALGLGLGRSPSLP